jgi:hypothetical protein
MVDIINAPNAHSAENLQTYASDGHFLRLQSLSVLTISWVVDTPLDLLWTGVWSVLIKMARE